MKKIRVLIVDDSIIYRSVLKEALGYFDFIEVTGVASNGKIALEKLKVSNIDLVILDLEMPELDGLSTLREMKKLNIESKVILFSSVTHKGAEVTLEGLRLGASDFVTKPNSQTATGQPAEVIKGLLLPKIKGIFNIQKTEEKNNLILKQPNSKSYGGSLWDLYLPKIITIGCSTGGPSVLEFIFNDIRGPLRCPIVIVQHMPPVFTTTLAERIGKLTGIPCAEARDGEVLKNQIYVAPGDFHLRLKGNKVKTLFELGKDEPINFVRPAVDPLFESASNIYREGCLGIVLTGMGQDGKLGCASIKKNEGAVVIQDEESSVVYGMPGAVKNEGHFDLVKTPSEIAQILKSKAVAMYG